MNRAVVCVAIALAVALSLAAATPTTPVNEHTSTWPLYSLVLRSGSGAYDVVPAADASASANGTTVAAQARYKPAMLTRGWNFLEVNTSGRVHASRDEEYYRAGFVEGYLTATPMLEKLTPGFWAANVVSQGPKFATFVTDHVAFMQAQAAANKRTDARWERVSAILSQLQGLSDGYNLRAARRGEPARTTFHDIFATNFYQELSDVSSWVAVSELHGDLAPSAMPTPQPTHCSALIRPTATDLFVSHDSWFTFQSMWARMYKTYIFSDGWVQMSSYPAYICSMDDWYMTSKGLGVLETTIVVFNATMYKALKPQVISEFIRVMVANYLSSGGAEWASNFAYLNSGTYNNEYVITDFKLFTPGQPLRDNTLWVFDQLPGTYEAGDATDVLRTQGYFASYNMPYYRRIYNVSGYAQQEQILGDFWSYTKYARPEMFRRAAPKIESLPAMQRMMRYNDYKQDPLSLITNCNGTTRGVCDPPYSAMLAIACRGDLNPPGGADRYGPAWSFLTRRDHTATDSKIAAWSTWQSMDAIIIGGPTNDQQPTFRWSTSPWPQQQVPAGEPDEFDFPWVRVTHAPPSTSDDAETRAIAIAYCVVLVIALLALAWTALRQYCPSTETQDAHAQPLVNASMSTRGNVNDAAAAEV